MVSSHWSQQAVDVAYRAAVHTVHARGSYGRSMWATGAVAPGKICRVESESPARHKVLWRVSSTSPVPRQSCQIQQSAQPGWSWTLSTDAKNSRPGRVLVSLLSLPLHDGPFAHQEYIKRFGRVSRNPRVSLLFQPFLPFVVPLLRRPPPSTIMYALAVLSIAVLAGQGEFTTLMCLPESDRLLTSTVGLQRLPPPPALSPPFSSGKAPWTRPRSPRSAERLVELSLP